MIRSVGVLAVLSLVCCARAPNPDAASSSAAPSGSAPAASSVAAVPVPTPSSTPSDAALADAPAGTAALAESPEPPALEEGGVDFIDQAKVLYRVAACGPTGDIPARFDADVVAKHCGELQHAYDDYRKSWVAVAKPFLSNLRPKDLPRTVVYPFGGGDMATALATFPDAAEITTVSLEPAGDIRPVDKLPPAHLAQELASHRAHLERLFEKAHSRTDNLDKEAHTDMPGEIVFDLAALVVHGDEPVSLRYFRIQPDGSLAYVTQADIDAAAHHPAALGRCGAGFDDWGVARAGARHAGCLFQNAEIRFRSAAGGPIRVLRHIAYNLDDGYLKADPSLIAHLTRKGKVAAMTKAASHLLWSDHFSTIRGWLIDHTDWMVSDSTGIPPRFAQPAGFVQDTYGTFEGPAPFGLYEKRDGDDLKRLFKAEPARDLPFRYGYPDQAGHAHMLVTRREPGQEAK